MKSLALLTVTALLGAGAAFAASTPTATPASATPAAEHAAKHSAMHCEKEAKARNLAGDAAKTFVKECREGKKS